MSVTNTSPQAAWLKLERLLKTEFHNADCEAAKVVLATMASHRIVNYPPAWLMLIAPPGSMKTALISACKGLPSVHLIDEFTTNTFISGKLDEPGVKRTKAASLLHRIGNEGVIVSADFSTLITGDRHKRDQIFSQFRRIYDGMLRREFGTSENMQEREWQGRITFVSACTPEIDKYSSVFARLGDRFLRVRLDRAGGARAAILAMNHSEQIKVAVQRAVYGLLLPILSLPQVPAPEFPEDCFWRLANFSEFIVKARSDVQRDQQGDVLDLQTESNTRLPQELAQIARGWVVLMGQESVEENHLSLVRRTGWDSIPPVRRDVLVAILGGKLPYSVTRPADTIDRALKDLVEIKLIECRQSTYCLSPLASDLVKAFSVGVVETP